MNEENPNWPAMFLCSGTDDNFGAHVTAQKIYDQIQGRIPAQLRLYEGAKHGFGIGTDEFPETFGWPYEADIFFQENKSSDVDSELVIGE
ncbi:MAG: hypothetical protein IJ106_08795 [Parasporobacterium sp.]|nr:hypothetical protein [Parasporobacterium sp.]